jgi:hypothetical protein
MTMFQYREYPASHGKIYDIASTNPYKEPNFESDFINNEAEFAELQKTRTREAGRRMDGRFYI